MNIVCASGGLQDRPVELKGVHTLIVTDNYGNPIYLARQQSESAIWTSTPADPSFVQHVQSMGLMQNLVITEVDGERKA